MAAGYLLVFVLGKGYYCFRVGQMILSALGVGGMGPYDFIGNVASNLHARKMLVNQRLGCVSLSARVKIANATSHHPQTPTQRESDPVPCRSQRRPLPCSRRLGPGT